MSKRKRNASSGEKVIKHIVFAILVIVLPILGALLANELYMGWYLLKTGETRAAQSENYGLAFETLLVMAGAFVFVFLGVLVFWLRSFKSTRED